MKGIGIAAAIKGSSYQQAVQSFFKNRNNLSKSHFRSPGQNTGLSKACFSCGLEGHIMRASYLPNCASPAVSANLPRSPCPRCQKGYHWVKDCRSRFHQNETLLVPDQQSGNRLQGQPQAPKMIGAKTLNPFVSFIPSQNSSGQPQAGLDLSSTTSTILTPDSPTIIVPIQLQTIS